MAKKIKGVGTFKGVAGRHSHAIVTGNFALCDARRGGLVVDKDAKPGSVTCTKCFNKKVYKEWLKAAKAEIRALKKMNFVQVMLTEKRKKIVALRHIANDHIFAKGLKPEAADIAVEKLNAIKDKWEAGKKMPTGFITQVRKTVIAACKKANVEFDKVQFIAPVKPASTKSKRKIARRQKRKVKRRNR